MTGGAAPRLVDAGGVRLALRCAGAGSPAVVLAAGLRDTSASWALVEGALAGLTQVCAYDRAGVGESERREGDATVGTLAAELGALLEAGGVPPPYVLCGHSFGGLVARFFAARRRADVAGLVLVDATHEAALDGASVREGGTRIDLRASEEELAATPSLDGVPLVVCERGRDSHPGWAAGQRRNAELARGALHVRALRSGHVIHTEQPELVAQAIRVVVEATRGSAPLPRCEDAFASVDGACAG